VSSASTSISFTYTESTCGDCQVEYLLSASPSSATPNLISIPTATSPSVQFAASSNVADAAVYTVTIKARFTGTTTWIATSSATFTYTNPCPSTTINTVAFGSVTAPVLSATSSTVTLWNDAASVSGGYSNACGFYTFTLSVLSAPALYVPASMSSMFALTSTTS
jgi:hypothetical protein